MRQNDGDSVMKNMDQQARHNVLMKLMHAMGDQMASRNPGRALHVEIKHGGTMEPPAATEPDECPHCDGEGCRFCK